MKKFSGVIIALVISYTLSAQDAVRKKKAAWVMPDYNVYKGQLYVPFALTTLDGKHMTNESSKGKVTLINFWFESCLGCRQEFAEVNELYDSLKNDTLCQFVAVTFDDAATLPPFIKEHKLCYPIATTGNRDTLNRLNYGMGCPSLVLLDKEGPIVAIGTNSIVRNHKSSSHQLSIEYLLALIRKTE